MKGRVKQEEEDNTRPIEEVPQKFEALLKIHKKERKTTIFGEIFFSSVLVVENCYEIKHAFSTFDLLIFLNNDHFQRCVCSEFWSRLFTLDEAYTIISPKQK